MVLPRPLSGCQIKAEIKGFLLVYRLFLYKHWFLPNFELKYFPEYTVTPCMKNDSFLNGGRGRKTVFQLPSNAIYHIMKGEKIM